MASRAGSFSMKPCKSPPRDAAPGGSAKFVGRRYAKDVAAFGKRNQWRAALDCVVDMRLRFGLETDIVLCCALAIACSKAGRWPCSLKLLQQSLAACGLEVDAGCVNVAITSWASGCHWAAALALLFVEALRKGLQPDLIGSSTAIRAASSCSQWQAAGQVLQHSKTHAMQPDVVMFSNQLGAVAANSSEHRWFLVSKMWEEMPASGLEPDEIIFNIAMGSMSKSLRWLRAVRLLVHASVQAVELDAVAHGVVVAADAQNCRVPASTWSDTLSLWWRLRDQSLQPDAVACGGAVSAVGRLMSWEAAARLLWAMHTEAMEPGSLSSGAVMASTERAAEWEASLASLSWAEVNNVEASLRVLSSAISACGGASFWYQAFSLWHSLLKYRAAADVVALNAVLSAFETCETGQWCDAVATMLTVVSYSLRIDVITINTAVSTVGKAEHWSQAVHLVATACSGAVVPDEVTYNAVTTACERSLHWQMALRTLSVARSLTIQADVVSYGALMGAVEKAHQWSQALALLGIIALRGAQLALLSFNVAMAACAASRRWQSAACLSEDIIAHRATPDATSYRILLAEFEQRGFVGKEASLLVGLGGSDPLAVGADY